MVHTTEDHVVVVSRNRGKKKHCSKGPGSTEERKEKKKKGKMKQQRI
jgi:hypothetical protein